MKLYHFASAAASVLVIAMSAPAFAQSGYVDVWGGSNRVHKDLQSVTDEGINGAVTFPVQMVEIQLEGSYVDTGRDGLTLTHNAPGQIAFDKQTLGSASVLKRSDKWAFGATVTGGDIGSVDFSRADTSTGALTETIDNLQEIEGGVFAATFGDKWVGSARVSYGRISGGSHRDFNPNYPTQTNRYVNVDDTVHYAAATLAGAFFITDNSAVTLGYDYRDLSNADIIMSGNLGFEWKAAKSPIGAIANATFNRYGNAISAGIVVNFGAGTLLELSKKGPVAQELSQQKSFQSLFVHDQ